MSFEFRAIYGWIEMQDGGLGLHKPFAFAGVFNGGGVSQLGLKSSCPKDSHGELGSGSLSD